MQRSFRLFPRQLYVGILLVAILYISNRRIFICTINPSCGTVNFLADYILWGLIVIGALLLLIHFGKVHEYWLAWKMNWALGLFILYSIASITWSISAYRSMHTVYIMVASSLVAAIFAIIYSEKQIFKILYLFTMASAGFSLILIIISPSLGIHQENIWYGAWHGIFRHKNDFGPIMALGNGLSLLYFARSTGKRDMVISISSYLLTLFMIVMSRCTTAVILWVILNTLSLLYFGWIKWHSKLRGKNLMYLIGLSTITALVGVLALIAVFIVTGKGLHLTGRVPLWMNLLENVVVKKPWFGYGLETLWYDPVFQRWASVTSGWGNNFNVVNGHNGYMDILLYLGGVGLVILSVVLIQGFVRVARNAWYGRTWLDLSPLLVFVYFLVANFTIDYILEFESFHWLILVTLLFLPLKKFTEQETI